MRSLRHVYLIVVAFACSNPDSAPLSPRVNHVMLYVADVNASVNFYTRAFELEETNRLSRLTVTKADGTEIQREIEIVLLKFPGQDFVYEITRNPASDTVGNPGLFQHVGVDVLDIDVALSKAIAAGAVLVAPVQTVVAGDIQAKQAFVKGPDGEMIELMQMIKGEF